MGRNIVFIISRFAAGNQRLLISPGSLVQVSLRPGQVPETTKWKGDETLQILFTAKIQALFQPLCSKPVLSS